METKRNLQLIGNTYFISLPRKWVIHHGLKKTDKLIIEFSDEPVLTISIPDSNKKKK